MNTWQPRYVQYSRQHEKTPAAMLAHDAERWPGGKLCGYILWVTARWSEWDSLNGHSKEHVRSNEEHAAFDAWLETLPAIAAEVSS
jgi:hypothetical protein